MVRDLCSLSYCFSFNFKIEWSKRPKNSIPNPCDVRAWASALVSAVNQQQCKAESVILYASKWIEYRIISMYECI